jgi:predicted DNA-binding protein with PD1-like motif
MQEQHTKTRASALFAVVPESGEEVMDCLKRFVASEKIGGPRITAIGAFRTRLIR